MDCKSKTSIEFVDCGSFNVKLEPDIFIKEEPEEYEVSEEEEAVTEESVDPCFLTENGIKEEPSEGGPQYMEIDAFLEKEWIEGSQLDVEDVKIEPKLEFDCDTEVGFLDQATLGFELPNGLLSDVTLPGPSGQTEDSSSDVEFTVRRRRKPVKRPSYKCHKCPYKTTVKRDLERHKSVHHNSVDDKDKEFQCDLCQTRFAYQRSLTMHRKNVHSIRKPFKCDQCSYTATRGNHLRLHVMSKHLGEKPIQCAICNYRCVQKGNMLDHIRNRHSGGEPFKCDRCRFQTSKRDELVTHITRVHLSRILKL